jgi:hypothetical protein
MIFIFTGTHRKDAILFSIAYMIIVDDMPLNTVEKKGFQFLMNTLEPKYGVPGRKLVCKKNLNFLLFC